MMKRLGWVALGFGLLAAQAGGSAIVHVLEGPLNLTHLPRVARGVDAMPVVLAGPAATPEVAAKINAALRRLDDKVHTAAEACNGTKPQAGSPLIVQEKGTQNWSRTVQVTMRGPRYLSVTATDDFYCGGAHPDGSFLPLVYDLRTGGTVNWLKLLPPGATSGIDDAADGNKVGAVIWPALTALARTHATKDCKNVFDASDAVPFVLWLDARSGSVMAQPGSFPHAVSTCAEAVSISSDQAKAIGGFNEELLDALDAAHKLQH